MKHSSPSTHDGFSKLRQWIRTTVPLAGVRRELLKHVASCQEQKVTCSFSVGEELNRSGSPLLVELRHGEIFVFALEGEQIPLLLNAPNGTVHRRGLSGDSAPPPEKVELLAFEFEPILPGNPQAAIAGRCEFRLAPGFDPCESAFPESHGAVSEPDPFSGFGSGFGGGVGPGEKHGTELPDLERNLPTHRFALDYDLQVVKHGTLRSIQITRYSYLWLRRGMTEARFEFGASPHDPETGEPLVPQALPVHLRLCAAPPAGSSVPAKPLSRALGKILVFG